MNTIKEKIKNTKKSTKALIVLAFVILVIVFFAFIFPIIIDHGKIADSVKEKAKEAGLENVSVSVKRGKFYDMTIDYVTVKCSNFEDLSSSEMLDIAWSFDSTSAGSKVVELSSIKSNGNTYTFENRSGDKTLYCNGKAISYLAKPSTGSSTAKTKCATCNGTGTVKYYYGESAWEAALNGQNDYEFGPCPSCGGTGYK